MANSRLTGAMVAYKQADLFDAAADAWTGRCRLNRPSKLCLKLLIIYR
jgi:hypothetical protein